MTLEQWIMVKFFLSACLGGQIVMWSLRALAPAAFEKSLSYSCSSTLQLGTVAAGAFVLGVGMTLSGACPGMVAAQIGSGVPSWATVAGCFLGAAVYGYLQPSISSDGHSLFACGAKPVVRT